MKKQISSILLTICGILPAIGQVQDTNHLATLEELPDSVQVWMKEKFDNATEKEPLLDYNSKTFFDKRPAHIVGYIKGYSPQLKFKTGIVNLINEITFDFHPVAFTIHPDGCFETDVSMIHPVCLGLRIKDQYFRFYAEPGRTLGIIIDWDAFLSSNQSQNHPNDFKYVTFAGILAKVNEDLKKVELETSNDFQNWKNYEPKEYKVKELEFLKRNQKLIQTKATEYKLSSKSRTILENQAFINYGINLFDYIKWKKMHSTIDTTTNQIFQTEIPDDYYDFLQTMPINEPSFLIPDLAMIFINRFEQDRLNHNWIKYIHSKGKPNTIWKYDPKARYESRDSVFLKEFHIPNSGLMYDIATAGWIKSENRAAKISRENSNELLYLASTKMTTPFVKTETKKMIDKFFDRKEQKIYVLPDTPAAKLFRSLISSFKGKYIVVDFWDIACGPCVFDIKQSKFTRENLKGKDVDFLFICDESVPEDKYKKFVEEQGLEHSVRLNYDQIKQMRNLFQFQGIPHYEYINREGNIMTTGLSMHQIEKTLKALLEKEKDELPKSALDMKSLHHGDK